MNRFQQFLYGLPRYLLASVATGLTIAQIALVFFLHGNSPTASKWAGWICLWTAGILALLPILTFRRKGGVPKGKSYMETTRLVNSGIYALVRHPQGGTAWLLINVGIMLIAWHWSSIVLGLASMVLVYADTFNEDQNGIEKFGDAYRRYMHKVPRVNILLGIIRYMRFSRKTSKE